MPSEYVDERVLSGRDDQAPESRSRVLVGDGAELPLGRLLVKAAIDGSDSRGAAGEAFLLSSHDRGAVAAMIAYYMELANCCCSCRRGVKQIERLNRVPLSNRCIVLCWTVLSTVPAVLPGAILERGHRLAAGGRSRVESSWTEKVEAAVAEKQQTSLRLRINLLKRVCNVVLVVSDDLGCYRCVG